MTTSLRSARTTQSILDMHKLIAWNISNNNLLINRFSFWRGFEQFFATLFSFWFSIVLPGKSAAGLQCDHELQNMLNIACTLPGRGYISCGITFVGHSLSSNLNESIIFLAVIGPFYYDNRSINNENDFHFFFQFGFMPHVNWGNRSRQTDDKGCLQHLLALTRYSYQ